IEGVLVQEMVDGVAEMILGVTMDPQVGPLVLLGTGGIFAEALEDVSLRPAPLRLRDVDDMLAELRGAKLLAGVRGRPAGDLAALRDTVLRLGRLAAALGSDLAELDINPLMVRPDGQGVSAVDALVVRAG